MIRTPALCFIALLCLPFLSRAETKLHPYVAEYEVLRNGTLEGKASIHLSREAQPDTWKLESRTEGTHGLAALAGFRVVETSLFRETPEGLRCISYHYEQRGLRKRERSIDCSAQDIVSRDHKGEYRFPGASAVIDRQTASLALASDLRSGKRDDFSYDVVDRERLESQHYRFIAEESVDVPAGHLPALRLQRQRENSERTTTTWYGPDQGYIPVRILQQEDDGDGFELRLTSVRNER